MNQVSIRRLVLNNFGAFRGHQELDFTNGLNLVAGANGSGKTTIFHALKSGLGVCLSDDESKFIELFGRDFGATGGERGDFQMEIEGTPPKDQRWAELTTMHGELTGGVDFLQMLFQKTSAPTDEFISLPFRGPIPDFLVRRFGVSEDVACRIARDGTLTFDSEKISDERLSSALWRGAAMGERTLTAFSILLQAREFLGCSIPLVIDSPFGCLDMFHAEVFAKEIQSLTCQVIILENQDALARVSLKGRRFLISQAKPDGFSCIQFEDDAPEPEVAP